MGWSLRNGLVDVTPFEEEGRIIVRNPLFILGDNEASVGGAIKQQNANVRTLLQLRRCGITRDDFRPFKVLVVLVESERFLSSTGLCRPPPHTILRICLDDLEYPRPVVRAPDRDTDQSVVATVKLLKASVTRLV